LSAHAFEEASRLTDEIKHLPARKQHSLNDVREINGALEALTASARATETELAAITDELDALARDADAHKMLAMEALVASLNDLRIGGEAGGEVVAAAIDIVEAERRTLERRLAKMKLLG